MILSDATLAELLASDYDRVHYENADELISALLSRLKTLTEHVNKGKRRAFMKGWKHARREQVRASGEALARYPSLHDALEAEYPKIPSHQSESGR